MILLKVYYHLVCWMKIFIYKMIYGKRLTMPMNCSFRSGFHLVIESSGGVFVGNNCFFNNYCTLASRAGITIGDGTIFGENVKVYDHNHCYKDVNVPIKYQGYTEAPIVIGKHCWIASNVVILKGVTIGDNCVIGAGCVVYKDVPERTVMVNGGKEIKR